MVYSWHCLDTSKHSIEFRFITKHVLRERLATLLAIRKRALAHAGPHVVLNDEKDRGLKPQNEDSQTLALNLPSDRSPDSDDCFIIESSQAPYVNNDNKNDNVWNNSAFSVQSGGTVTAMEPETMTQLPETPHSDNFPTLLERILDANDAAKALIDNYREAVLGMKEESPDMPTIETQIRDRIRLFIKDPEKQQEAYEDALRDGHVILNQCPEDGEYDPPLINGFDFSGLMKGRNLLYPVAAEDIERLDDLIAKTADAEETVKEGIRTTQGAKNTNRKRWKSRKLGGGIINFMKSQGRGSALRQCIHVDDEWPDDWTLGMEGESRRMMSKKYEEAATAMLAADALGKPRWMRNRDPKW